MAEERVHRRLAAILAADVVGYSRLMGADEAGTLARLKALRKDVLDPKVAEYGGRIVKTTGDGILIEFSSAVDAVQHAVDVQRELKRRNAELPEPHRFDVRMGINVGDVIIDGDDLYGDGVNIAARLEALAEPGGICISGTVHEHVRSKLELEIDDQGEQSVKNIAEPIHVFRVLTDAAQPSSDAQGPSDALFRRPPVAVLPFENLSGDVEQDYFADGLSEDIITALSLLHSFPVIARNSTFAYKGQSPDIRRIGKELGARYVIEGSVRRSGNRVRVTAQLINAETGHHVWAERYDRDLEDIFELQDEITHRIAATVEPELERAEGNRISARRATKLSAWEFCQRGMVCLHEYAGDANARAREMFDCAIEQDPDYAPAYIGLAYSHYRDVRIRYVDDLEDAAARLMASARRAVELDDLDSRSHWVLGCAYQIAEQWDLAIAEGQRSVQLNPNFAYAHFALGGTYLFSGRPEDAIGSIQRTYELNPRDPRSYAVLSILIRAYLNCGRYDDAVAWARRAITLRADRVEINLLLASALGHLGQLEEARRVADFCEREQPGSTQTGLIGARGSFIIKVTGNDGGSGDPDPMRDSHYLEGLRKAGAAGP